VAYDKFVLQRKSEEGSEDWEGDEEWGKEGDNANGDDAANAWHEEDGEDWGEGNWGAEEEQAAQDISMMEKGKGKGPGDEMGKGDDKV
jgi:hypothetical protein